MDTRNKSPFPTHECADDNCTNTVPKSTRSELCASCDNFTQIFGEHPSDVDTVNVQLRRTWLFGEVVNWRVELIVDGDRDVRGPFKEEKARRLKRQYETATYALE